ncbi:sensor histidine kinase [Bremerella alba]|uniref:histidine kinase n=1 Tax=Bremerella alba TaxID=980252 RepID=A0A7V8V668_9BACT|nr:ATP-binding protein [Bremerella alba]MBA2115591.1 Adaptive-response sensory-kinase SasA [Bremerella alba]
MLKMPIRWRLTFWYASALAIILIVFCGLLIPLSYRQLLARMDAELHEELQELFLEVQIANSTEELDSSLWARFRQHETFDFIVYDQQQAVLFASADITPKIQEELAETDTGAARESFETYAVESVAYYRVASRSADGPRGKLTVRVLTPLDPIIADIETLLLLMAVLLPLSLVIALLVGYFLATRALAPVEQIVGVANSISISQLNRRIEVSNPHDELGHLAGTLNRLIARLEHAVDEIRRFTADASHELRTPLAILRSEAESALRKSRTEEEYQATLRVVIDEATRLGTLADQLLNLSRQDSGIDTHRVDSVEIDPIMLDVVETLRPLAETRKIELRTRCKSNAVIAGEDIPLSQAFFNVLDNAVKYSVKGSVVEIESVNRGNQVHVIVRDNGVGISAEHLPHVFKRFYRVDASRNRAIGGFGLGLAIAKSVIASHRGTIEIQSKIGTGTEVTICFEILIKQNKPITTGENTGDLNSSEISNSHAHVGGS